MDTKQKILDTAERLIATQGFAGTSLRQIISEAGVNLAAVHYHFGSKQDLLDHVILRKAAAVNEERHRLIEQFESEAGSGSVSVEKVLTAFFKPMIEAGARNPQFVKLMGRMYGEGLLPVLIEKHFQPTLTRFAKALHRARPELSEGELRWRMQFMFGAMSQALCGQDIFPQMCVQADDSAFVLVMRRLMVFLCAGFQAPAVPEAEKDETNRYSAGGSPALARDSPKIG
jgi:AcrR family transcriptional regulator